MRRRTPQPLREVNKKLLDLNSADRKLLTQVPGITKDIAYKIVSYRNHHGGFSSWSNVQTATGFPRAKMDRVQERAFLGPRPSPVSHERQTISRWRGKPDDELHAHG